jgi:hypothetical protein
MMHNNMVFELGFKGGLANGCVKGKNKEGLEGSKTIVDIAFGAKLIALFFKPPYFASIFCLYC